MMKMKWMGLAAICVTMVVSGMRAGADEPSGPPPLPLSGVSAGVRLNWTSVTVGGRPLPEPFLVLEGQSADSGIMHASGSSPDASGAAGGSFGFGWASANSVRTPSQLGIDGLYGNASTGSGSFDRIQIMPQDPGLLGQRGRFAFTMLVEGHGSAITMGNGDEFLFAQAQMSGSVGFSGSLSRQGFSISGNWDSFGGGDGQFTGMIRTLYGHDTVSIPLATPEETFGQRTFWVDFIFGEHLYLMMGGGTQTYVHGNLILGQSAWASAQLAAFQWLGMSGLEDEFGNAVGYMVLSHSGVDWSKPAAAPVPEPAALAWIAVMGLLLKRRRPMMPAHGSAV